MSVTVRKVSANPAPRRASRRVREQQSVTLMRFLRSLADDAPDELVGRAAAVIAELLGARRCDWEARAGGLPLIHDDGHVRLLGPEPPVTTTDEDTLPTLVALTAGTAGRFVVESDRRQTSLEQRRAAYSIALAVGRVLAAVQAQ